MGTLRYPEVRKAKKIIFQNSIFSSVSKILRATPGNSASFVIKRNMKTTFQIPLYIQECTEGH